MFLLLGLTTYLIFENKFSKSTALIAGLMMLTGSLILSHLMKVQNYNLFLYFMFSFYTIYSMSMILKIQVKRKIYAVSLFLIPLMGVLANIIEQPLNAKKALLAIVVGLIIGFISEALTSLPFGFQSFKEFFYFQQYLNSKRKDIKYLIQCLEINISNFVTTKELFSQIMKNQELAKTLDFKKTMVNSLFYWTQKEHFNSMNPLVQRFNAFEFEQLKKNFAVYDLSDSDVELIFNIFRCGCWKPGLFILDQYLIGNKLSSKYPSTLIFADKFLNDLKKVSFDDESIEYWLQQYSEVFKGTPIAQKINLVYHNKDDWFNRDRHYAAV